MSVSPDHPTVSETPSEAARPTSRETAACRARAATRARLVESGKALFAEHGLRVTTHDIAFHAGVASGTFYNHFKDKAELFRVIADEAVAELSRRLQCAGDPSNGLRDNVRPMAEALVGFAEDHADFIHILFSREATTAATEAAVLDLLARDIVQGREASIERGEMPAEIDPNVLAHAMVGMWARVMAWWAEDPSRAPRETVIETLTRIQLSGTHPA
jgi:AcrR family transcriptional regulator